MIFFHIDAIMNNLPTLNTVFNAASAIFLTIGLIFIKLKRTPYHKLFMVAAFFASTFFLAGYIIHHALHGATRYSGHGWTRPVYFSLLILHTALAFATLPLVLGTFGLALKKNFERHKRLAQWTWPLWMTVSVSGVLVYFMLYH